MKEEIYQMISLAQSGDKNALEEIIIKNKGLIWCAVRKYCGRGVDADDLFQIGSIGLLKAVKKFDKSYNVEFSTYAVPMIMGEIRRFLRDDGMIKVSRALKETAYLAAMVSEKIFTETGREASIREIAEKLDKPQEEIALALEAMQPTESIYRSIYDGDSNRILLIDKIYNRENNEEKLLTSVALKQAIEKLPRRDREILILRYYKEKTQSEVAGILGVSQVQVSRIEKKLLSALRKSVG